MGIKFIIDSASDYDIRQAESEGHLFVPLTIIFPDSEYLDAVELSHEQFYQKLASSPNIPQTSQVNPQDFKEVFEKATKDGDVAIAILLSSKLSGTYASAVSAAKDFQEGSVYVIDSLNVTVGLQLLIKYAMSLRDSGKNAPEIVKALEAKKQYVHTMGLLDTLKYLRKGGRLSATAAFAGGLLNVKPYAKVLDGKVCLAGKSRGTKQGMAALKQMVEDTGIDKDLPILFGYTGLDNSTMNKFIELCRPMLDDVKEVLPTITIGSTIGTHIGPGTIAIGFFSK